MRAARATGSIVVTMSVWMLLGCPRIDDPATAAYWLERLENRHERAEALEKLGRIGDKSALPAVARWFDKEGDWQAEAAFALGELGDASVVDKLVAGMSFEPGPAQDARARQRSRTNIGIVRALGRLRAKEAAPAIKRLLAVSDNRAREAALHALGLLGDPANTPALIEHALKDDEPVVRLAAIEALGNLGDPRGASVLIQLLFLDPRGLSFYVPARSSLLQLGPVVVPELLRTLERRNPAVEGVRMSDGSGLPEGAVEARTASVLGTMRAAEAVEPMIAALGRLRDRAKKGGPSSPAYYAVIEVAYALGSVGGANAVAALTPMLKDPDPGLRVATYEALTAAGDHGVTPQIIAAARSGDPQSRRSAVLAASRLGRGEDLPAFDALGKAGDGKAAAATMAEMVLAERRRLVAAQECGSDTACWRRKLADPEPKVRDRAAYELGWKGTREAVDELLTAADDRNVEVRMAAVLSLARLGVSDTQKLEAVYGLWKDKLENASVNEELLRLIARSKGARARR